MEKPSEAILERRAKCREYHRLHKKEISARKKKYYEDNKDKIAEYHKARREKRNSVRRKHYAENREHELEVTYGRRKRMYGGATIKVANAIVSGRLAKNPCEICGAEKAEAHHDDYNKPLEVRWLCKTHHTEWHKNNKPKYLEATK